MKFSIKTRYEDTGEVWELTNPGLIGTDQYVPAYEFQQTIQCKYGIDPRSGRLNVYVPEPITDIFFGYIRNPKNKDGVPLGIQGFAWRLGAPVPQINAYGRIIGWMYETIESDQ